MVETQRLVHYKRCRGRNADGSENFNVWIDVERIDDFSTEAGRGATFVRLHTHFKRNHDGQAEDEPLPANSTRGTTILKLRETSGSDAYVPLRRIETVDMDLGGQRIRVHLENDPDPSLPPLRRIEVARRVYHWDTPYDDDVVGTLQGIFPYERTPGTKDPDQYIDVWVTLSNASEIYRGKDFQRLYLHLVQDPILAFSEPLPDNVPIDNHLLRLDPYQNIVNVQWHTPGEPFVEISFSLRRTLTGDSQDIAACNPATISVGGQTAWDTLIEFDAVIGPLDANIEVSGSLSFPTSVSPPVKTFVGTHFAQKAAETASGSLTFALNCNVQLDPGSEGECRGQIGFPGHTNIMTVVGNNTLVDTISVSAGGLSVTVDGEPYVFESISNAAIPASGATAVSLTVKFVRQE